MSESIDCHEMSNVSGLEPNKGDSRFDDLEVQSVESVLSITSDSPKELQTQGSLSNAFVPATSTSILRLLMHRFYIEMKDTSWFDIVEIDPENSLSHSKQQCSTMIRHLDLLQMFCSPEWYALPIRIVGLTLILSAWITLWTSHPYKSLHMIYFTNWTLTLLIGYFSLVILLSVFPSLLFCSSKCQGSHSSYGTTLEIPAQSSRWFNLVWTLFTVTIHSEPIIVILYWSTLAHVTYYDVIAHMLAFALVVVDGMMITRIPLRAKHFVFCLIYTSLYMIWMIIHSQTNIETPQTDDDAIYPGFNLNNDTAQASLKALGLLFFVSPAMYVILWVVSLYRWPFHFDGRHRHTENVFATNIASRLASDLSSTDQEIAEFEI
jgi:hypothetical protein